MKRAPSQRGWESALQKANHVDKGKALALKRDEHKLSRYESDQLRLMPNARRALLPEGHLEYFISAPVNRLGIRAFQARCAKGSPHRLLAPIKLAQNEKAVTVNSQS